MGSTNTEELTKYIKKVYSAKDVTHLRQRVCDPKHNDKDQLKKISQEMKDLLARDDHDEMREWMEKKIKQIDGPDLNKTITKIQGA